MNNKINEIIATMKEDLKGMLTAENTEAITKLDKYLDDIGAENKAREAEVQQLKDKVVDVVKATSFASPVDEDEVNPTKTLSVDEALERSLAKIIKENNNNG